MKNPLRSGIVALIAVAFSTADSWAARTASARLTIADKNVTIAGQPAASGTTIAGGDTIVTGRRSHAELTLPDGTVVRIGQGSSFTYTGSKLVLNQGTALVRVAHKNTTVTTPARTYTGGPSVISAQASKSYDGIFVLQGSGKVNGQPLIAGQTSVLDKGKDRTFSFDLQKLVGSSALVTQFPQTPWIVQTEALGAIQHQLLTGAIVQAAQPVSGGQQAAVTDATSGLVSTRASQILSKNAANFVSTGAGGPSFASRGGLQVTNGALTIISGGSLSLGANTTLSFTGGSIAAVNNAGAGTLQISNPVISSGVGVTNIGTIGGLTLNTVGNGGTLNLNQQGTGGVISSAGTINVNGSGLTKTGMGVLTLGATTATIGGTAATAPILNTGGTLTILAGTTGGISATTLNQAGALTITGVNTITRSGTGVAGTNAQGLTPAH